MTVPYQEISREFEQNNDQKSVESSRLKFRMDVQIRVMKILGYFSSELEKITDDNRRMLMVNDVFYKWVSDGKSADFAKCYQDIVPAGSDRSKEEAEKVALMVAVEMGAELKH